MAWTSPPTFVSGNALTAAQLNILGGDLNETAPAKFTTAGQIFVATGSNAGAARSIGFDAYGGGGTDATNSTSYTALTGGGAVTATTGTSALVSHFASITNDTTGTRSYASYAISGSTTLSAQDTWALIHDVSGGGRTQKSGLMFKHTGLTAGSNTFTQQFKVAANTGTFLTRGITVIPL
jgi:hypothetical protein